MKKLLTGTVFFSVLLFGENLIIKPSSHDVQTTMDKMEKIVKSKGATVFARIDHRAAAKKAGMEMNEEQVLVFGKPKAGTSMMLRDPRVGVDLPMRDR